MKQSKRSIFIFMAPAMFLFAMMFVYPVVRTAMMSFFNVKSVTSTVDTWTWAGFQNYISLFNTPLFMTSVKNICKIFITSGIACLGLALLLAIILTQNIVGQRFFRAIVYMPNVIADVWNPRNCILWRCVAVAAGPSRFRYYGQEIDK